jgi:hypothetical protein
MLHLSPPRGTFPRRYRLAGIVLALLLACGALLTLGGTGSASALAVSGATSVTPDVANPAVAYANSHWNWTFYNHATRQACTNGDSSGCFPAKNAAAGQFQPQFQCTEFVSRALAAEGFIPGRNANSAQTGKNSFETYKPGNGKTYDLLLVTPDSTHHTLVQFLETFGYAKNVGHNLGNAEPGDMVVFNDLGSNGKPVAAHIGLIVKKGKTTAATLIDAHNTARHNFSLKSEISGFSSWYILHIVPGQS